MRHNSVQVMVVAVSEEERKKVHNIVTAPSSLLIWLVSFVGATLPGKNSHFQIIVQSSTVFHLVSLMQLKSSEDPFGFLAIVHYQIAALFVLGTVVSVLYIGSSSQLREEVLRLRKILFRGYCTGSPSLNENRPDVYTIENNGGLTQVEREPD